jgi:hypothetical protein
MPSSFILQADEASDEGPCALRLSAFAFAFGEPRCGTSIAAKTYQICDEWFMTTQTVERRAPDDWSDDAVATAV